jgi:hypothetical protein
MTTSKQMTELPPPSIYHDRGGRGAAFREWAFAQWCEADPLNGFGSIDVSHGWRIGTTSPGARLGGEFDFDAVDHCLPTLMHASLACPHNWWEVRDEGAVQCQCVAGSVHRGACLFCDWEGEIVTAEYQAIEDAHDHAWPGWRELPLVRSCPADLGGKKSIEARHRWAVEINSLYPTGWLEQGGPIRTKRLSEHRLHMPNATGFGGYDMGDRIPDEEDGDE